MEELLLQDVGLVPVPVLPSDRLLPPQTSQFLFYCCSEMSSFLPGPALAPCYHSSYSSLLLQTFLLRDLLHCTRLCSKIHQACGKSCRRKSGDSPTPIHVATSEVLAHVCTTALRRESEKLPIFLFSQAGTQRAGASLSGSCSALVSA